jgi:hypothetical protein
VDAKASWAQNQPADVLRSLPLALRTTGSLLVQVEEISAAISHKKDQDVS